VKSKVERFRVHVFSDDVLSLFAELNRTPQRDRESDAFKAEDRRLARMLGLGGPWLCSGASVVEGRPLRSASMTGPTFADHLKVRGVREQLFEAIKEKSAPEQTGVLQTAIRKCQLVKKKADSKLKTAGRFWPIALKKPSMF
jgi:hypothetical protein